MHDLRKAILGEPIVRKVLSAGKEVFLVGGFLRDLLRGVKSRDIDFVVKCNPKDFLSKTLRDIDCTLVEFRDFAMVRSVLQDYTLDFTEVKGELEEDLLKRDFTVNAIAWSAERGIIDPLGGRNDVERGIIKAVSEKNLIDDPLRLLRAYRLASEIGWDIDRETRKMIRKLKGFIRESSSERITLEIFKLLNSTGHVKALKQAFIDGLLNEILYVDKDKLQDNIKVISSLGRFLKKVPEELSRREEIFSQGLTYGGLLRAEQLFYGSDHKKRLILSRAVSKRLEIISMLLTRYEKKRVVGASLVFDLFTTAGDAAMDFALLRQSIRLVKEAERFLRTPPLLSAEKVMDMTGLTPGPELGRVLREIKKMQFLNRITNGINAAERFSLKSHRLR